MQITIVKKHELYTKPWGAEAGFVSEVYRYPAADIDDEYLVRFSTATIEIPVSDFTLYPGYIRHHRTLDGQCEFQVDANNNSAIVDQSGTVFDFSGESRLQCKLLTPTAFAINLIHRPHLQVSDRVVQVEATHMPLHKLFNVPLCARNLTQKRFNVIYVMTGRLGIEDVSNGEQHTLSAGDTLVETNDSMGANNPMWRITHCSAKIYHGMVLCKDLY